MTESYLDIPRLLERLHRRFLDILQAQLSAAGFNDVSPVQVFLMLDIGEEEISLQELINRGNYLRSNALHNIKKLVESGHFEQTRSPNDRRAVRIKLTPRARDICAVIRRDLKTMDEELRGRDERPDELITAIKALRQLERNWGEYLRYGLE
ncbi:MAG TPA: winged helix DNA-binding protein [Aliidongia sp.]|nr:winged helix DNA-binding protein [Aliidongia sp.]